MGWNTSASVVSSVANPTPAMKELLKKLNLYHPLQSRYRSALDYFRIQSLKRKYSPYKTGVPPYQCNFCGAKYQKFVPEYPTGDIREAIEKNHVIAGFGENVYCPACLSKNRERLVKAVLENYTTIYDKNILHFSPEKHLYHFLQKTAKKVTTVDIEPGFYRHIDKNISKADATDLPFANETFDILVANHILEHIPDDQAAMKEMHRVLNAKGLAILQVPYSETITKTLEEPDIDDPEKQAALFGQKDHVRIYAKSDYINRLQHAGFRVNILTPEILKEYRVYAIQEDESVFLCSKAVL